MKFYRFVASDNQKAIVMAQEALGNDAYIYSTKRTDEGIEILAGVAGGDILDIPMALPIQGVSPEYKLIDSVNMKLELVDSSIKRLFGELNILSLAMSEIISNQNKPKKWNPLVLIDFDLMGIMLWNKLYLIQESLVELFNSTVSFIKYFKPIRSSYIRKI